MRWMEYVKARRTEGPGEMFIQPENVRRIHTRWAIIILCSCQRTGNHSEGKSGHSKQDSRLFFRGHASGIQNDWACLRNVQRTIKGGK